MSDPRGRMIHTATLLVSAALFSVLLWRSYSGVGPRGADVPASVAVEIKGDVPAPGMYLLDPERATVGGALSAAGLSGIAGEDSRGLEPGASLSLVKTDGGPRVCVGRMPASSRLAAGLKLDLNSASGEDLMLAPLMRPDVASAIVKRRLEKPWERIADLVEIHGIGPKTAQKFAEFLEVPPGGPR